MLLLIDNYDSFTHNLARYFVELGETVEVVRNDKISVKQIDRLSPESIVISPGPCKPDQAGVSLATVSAFAGKIPMLGVCLGHQTIAQAFGADIVTAQSIKHGMTSTIQHKQTPLFKDVAQPFTATRYHSLVVESQSLSDDFIVSAWVNDVDSGGNSTKEIMAFEHQQFALCGVQFHPESLMTDFGHQILSNFLTHPNRVNQKHSLTQ